MPTSARRKPLKYSSAQFVHAPSSEYASLWQIRLTSKRSCRLSHDPASSACTTVPLAIRARMKAEAWLSEWNTAETEFPPRLRTITNDLALAALILSEAAINALLFAIGGLT